LKALVETSPAAIVTVDEPGFIELANHAANDLMMPPGGNLVGTPIEAFLPDSITRRGWKKHLSSELPCNAKVNRGNGEIVHCQRLVLHA
jgi:nitrogen-specific signal transduction histidine kinase